MSSILSRFFLVPMYIIIRYARNCGGQRPMAPTQTNCNKFDESHYNHTFFFSRTTQHFIAAFCRAWTMKNNRQAIWLWVGKCRLDENMLATFWVDQHHSFSYAYEWMVREQNIIYIFTMGKGHNHHSRITASRCATDFVSSKMDNTMNIIFRDIKIGIFKSSNWFCTKNRRLTGIWLLFFFPFIFWILVVGLIWLSSPQNHALLFCNLHSCCLSGPVCIYMRAAVDTSIVWRSLSSTL